MKKQPIKSFRQNSMTQVGENTRRALRSCPRIERLEEQIVISTFQVNRTLDTVAVNLRTGKDAAGHISLRSAIMAADARGGSNTINLRKGTYTL